MAIYGHFSIYSILCIMYKLHFIITTTCLYNFDPLKPHFYIVQLWFTAVYIIFLMSAQKIDCFEEKYEKWSEFFYLKIFSFWR